MDKYSLQFISLSLTTYVIQEMVVTAEKRH